MTPGGISIFEVHGNLVVRNGQWFTVTNTRDAGRRAVAFAHTSLLSMRNYCIW